ncbi:MAG: hypothetical protein A3F84_28615 [Candidatus Handelsmanbacteria bacterium RIFCSPLOWO2_12_FULL_64_10]|uniref:POTRA domain-containing protein n=1 Tax=Handelsmanbacteria sp. (strain RIFCSPLOWO2_12_FULL_64_10) TaxID=1817868 RepID=A0A1F6CQV7_HANXR|nr:MAG: hypothetical protein A3F84_28615 [Candidatus Handelsmanbacteria bacterium RIFCSPLOWO2_12_FULL_64_10]
MRTYVLCFAFCLLPSAFCLPALADPPLVSSVRIEGARLLSARDLLSSLETRLGGALDSLALRRDVGRILDRCRAAGLYLAEVDPPEVVPKGRGATDRQSDADVAFRLREGPPARVRRLAVSDPDSADLLAGMQTRPGRPFRPAVLEADVEAILRRCENAGRPFCAVYPEVSAPTPRGEIDVSLRIDRGPAVRVGDLRVSGNRVTRLSVIRRLMGLRAGDPYDQRRVDRAREALIRSGLFDAVGEAILSHDARSEAVHLTLQIVERKASRIDGVLGYAPGEEGQRGHVAGVLDLALRNLGGVGRSASVRWDRRGPSASDLSLGYDEPWIGPTSFSGRLRFALLQRPGYASTDLRAGLGRPLAGPLTVEAEVGWEQVSPDSSGLGLVPRGRTWTGAGGLSVETRDDPDNPRTGGALRASISLGRAALLARRVNRWRTEADAERLVPLFTRQTLAIAAHVRSVHTGAYVPPLNEKVRLGGASSLRGYREEQFLGVRAAWGGVEYRFLLGRRSRIFLFLDAGAISDRQASGADILRTTRLRIGYGAGLRAESRAGIVGLDFGLGQDDGLAQGKVHVRMMRRF